MIEAVVVKGVVNSILFNTLYITLNDKRPPPAYVARIRVLLSQILKKDY